jgi:hypothetical protein
VLSASGVNKALREKGIREGDLVIVNQVDNATLLLDRYICDWSFVFEDFVDLLCRLLLIVLCEFRWTKCNTGGIGHFTQMEFNWSDTEDMSKLTDWKRGVRGSKVWPH